MLEDIIYSKKVLYNRKGKWRNCQLQIEIIRRCQDKLVATINGINDKAWVQRFSIYGYECNNYCVSLIGNNRIHRIKLESLEKVQILTELLEKYMKDVSFKFQLLWCSCNQELLLINEWYTLHVQTNRVCLTTDDGNRLITKWNRSEIGHCYIENSNLNIQIISNNEKMLYSFFRDEKFPLEKIRKAIDNLKFELTLPKQEKLPSTPRRSSSIDFRRVSTWGNTKERIARERSSYSYRTCDYSNDVLQSESSLPSTPCSPPYTSFSNDQSKDYSHIGEEVVESEDLIFPFDNMEIQSNEYKELGYPDSNVLGSSNMSNNHKLVHLERRPFESERKSQGKRSPETMMSVSPAHTTTNIINPNVHEKFLNDSRYQTMNYIEHNRKSYSDTNCKGSTETGYVSHSVDVSCNSLDTRPVSPDKISLCSSPLILLSSSNTSSRTPASLKSKDRQSGSGDFLDNQQLRLAARRTSYSDSNHNYYNLKTSMELHDSLDISRPNSNNDDTRHIDSCRSSRNEYYNFIAEDQSTKGAVSSIKVPSLNYSTICFSGSTYGNVLGKVSPQRNYKEIDLDRTNALKEVDDNISNNLYSTSKRKKPKIFKYFKK